MKPSLHRLVSLCLAFSATMGCSDVLDPSHAPYLPSASQQAGHLTSRFFGVTTLLFDDGDTAIMIDGFFSRPGPVQVAIGQVEPSEHRIAHALGEGGRITHLDALFVAHSHYDHALDSANVAKRTGALLLGSRSTANIGLGDGLPDSRICILDKHATYTFGEFTITPYRSRHSPKAHFLGEIEQPLRPPAHVSQYREGGSYSFLIKHRDVVALVHPSADVRAGMYENVRADIVFLGIGTLGQQDDTFVKNYWDEVVGKTEAKLVIPIHWDDFTLPLTSGLKPMPRAFDEFAIAMTRITEIAAEKRVDVRFMPLFAPVDLAAAVETGRAQGQPVAANRKQRPSTRSDLRCL